MQEEAEGLWSSAVPRPAGAGAGMGGADGAGMGVQRGFWLPTTPGSPRVALAALRTGTGCWCRQGWREPPGMGRSTEGVTAAARSGDKLLELSHPSG